MPRWKAKQVLKRYVLIPGARKAEFPAFISPALPTQHPNAPSGDRWVHEIKGDGYRCQLHVRRGRISMYTRRGYNWASRFRAVAEAAQRLPVNEAIIDGRSGWVRA